MAKANFCNDRPAENNISKLIIKIISGLYIILCIASVLYLIAYKNLIPISPQLELWLHLAYGYWIAMTFLIAQIGLGRWLFRISIFRAIDLTGSTYVLFCLGSGLYISYFYLLASAWLFQFNRITIILFFLISVAAAVAGIKTIKRAAFFYTSNKTDPSPKIKTKRLVSILIVILFLLWFTPFFIQTLMPNTDWDGAAYHLPLAKRFLAGKINSVDPTFLHYNFAGAINLFYSILFAANAETAIVPLNFLISFIIILAVYSLAHSLWNKKAALWAAIICTAVNLLWEVALTPRIDVYLSLFFLLTCNAFLIWISNKKKFGLLVIIGMMLGMAIGIKFTAIFLVAIILLSIIIHSWNVLIKNFKQFYPYLLVCLLTIVIPSGWWYVRNAVSLGDPIYPFYSGQFFINNSGEKIYFNSALEDWQKRLPSKKEISSEMEYLYKTPLFYSETESDKKPQHLFFLWDILANPEKYQRNPYHEINIFIFLFLLLPFFSRKKQLMWLYGIALIIYIIIGFQSYLVRYALPVFPLFAIGAGVVLSRMRSKALIMACSIGLCLNLFYFNYFEWKKLTYIQPSAYLLQELDRVDWLVDIGYNLRLKDTPLLIKYVNDNVDDGSMEKSDILFMIGECKGNLLKSRYLPDPGLIPVRWLAELIKAKTDYQLILNNFQEKKIEYLVVNKAYFRVIYERYPETGKPIIFGLYHLSRFLKNYTEILYNTKDIILAKVKQ